MSRSGEWAEWAPPTVPDRWYKIEVYVADAHANAHAHYVVREGDGYTREVVVDQTAFTNAWVSLGPGYSGSGRLVVHLTDRGDPLGSTLVGVDAARFTITSDPNTCGPPPSMC